MPGALEALQAALELAEAEAPLEPGRPDVVSLMNLHQAKGLEAEVVILADPTGSRARTPEIHMHRTADGAAVGYLRVTEYRDGYRGDQVLARPEGWEAHQSTESRFEAAEEVRLLYVAVRSTSRRLRTPSFSVLSFLESCISEPASRAKWRGILRRSTA